MDVTWGGATTHSTKPCGGLAHTRAARQRSRVTHDRERRSGLTIVRFVVTDDERLLPNQRRNGSRDPVATSTAVETGALLATALTDRTEHTIVPMCTRTTD